MVEACYHMRDRFNQKEVWENLGLPVKECVEAVEKSEHMRMFRTRLFIAHRADREGHRPLGPAGAQGLRGHGRDGVRRRRRRRRMLENDNRVAEEFDAKRFVAQALATE